MRTDLFDVVLVPGATKHFAHTQSCHVTGETLRQPPVIPDQIHNSESHTVDVLYNTISYFSTIR